MRTKLALTCGSCCLLAALAQLGRGQKSVGEAETMTARAREFVALLNEQQKSQSVYPVDSPKIVGWHFIPMDTRKGLQLNEMDSPQRAAAAALLQSVLSAAGYAKATKIMSLETLLKELQSKHGGRGPIRDPLRYYFTLFGDPTTSARWGLSIEGHHLSLNFVIDGDQVVSSTPQFFATNPATVKSANDAGIALGTRVLRREETLAFELVNSLSAEQRQTAVIAAEAPAEIRAAGEPQPPQDDAAGIAWAELSEEQRPYLRRLVNEYANAMPSGVAAARLDALRQAGGFRELRFAWAGALHPGVGHYYRVQGPTLLIEFVNTQPDSDGNPANHIHCVWRDMRGDFGLPASSN